MKRLVIIILLFNMDRFLINLFFFEVKHYTVTSLSKKSVVNKFHFRLVIWNKNDCF